MPDLTGKTLGKYQIIARLGCGGMAEVYKGRHQKLERYVAVKLLHGHLAEGEDFRVRFEREAQAVAALRHPHIVQVYDFDVADERPYMVMEYVDGVTLKERLARQAGSGATLEPAEAARIFRQVAEALGYAHQQGMLHRDIKSANVLLDRSGFAYLTDFGLARILGGGGSQLTTTGTLIGTPAYMSPEQGKGLELTTASDIYSLGVVLYELFTGQVPFEADTPWGVIEKHVSATLPLLSTIRPDLPQALQEVISRALAKDPAARYATPLEMAEAVDLALGQCIEAVRPTAGAEPDTSPDGAGEVAVETEQTLSAIAALPTVAMNALPDSGGEVEKARPAVASEPPFAAPRYKSSNKKRIVLPLAVILIAAVVLALVFSQGGGTPKTVDYHHDQAARLVQEGNLDGAIEQLERALKTVSAADRPAFAQLWLMRGDLYRELMDFDLARDSYRRCIEWTGEDPDLQHLRNEAEERLRKLPG